jgi:hypothetical protein
MVYITASWSYWGWLKTNKTSTNWVYNMNKQYYIIAIMLHYIYVILGDVNKNISTNWVTCS